MESPFAFAVGMTAVVFLGTAYRLIRGLRLHLLLIQREGMRIAVSGREGRDQIVIPITMENRRSFSWRGIREKRWRESVELTLADDEGHYAELGFSFHPWKHFVVNVGHRPGTPSAEVKLNQRLVIAGRGIRLVDGDRLDVGRRRYSVRVTSAVSDVGSI